jgi:hypothetical protein
LLSPASSPADAVRDVPPRIFWASAPVRPDETVLVQGSDFGPKAIVEMARLDGGTIETPTDNATAQIKHWTSVPVLQASDESLKCAVPMGWDPGVFACRIKREAFASEPILLNAPDPWWVQGDEGDAATPGGWLRILGKSLAGMGPAAQEARATIRLEPENGVPIVIMPCDASGFSLRMVLPKDLARGRYTVRVHNGSGGAAAWRSAGAIQIVAKHVIPTAIFNVLESYGPAATVQMRKSLVKYNPPLDRTEGILAALKKAKDNGGGTVYFPAGRYTLKGPLSVPDNTVLKGEGMGVVTLWWGTGAFNLDGGGPQGRALEGGDKVPQTLISGRDYGLEEMSIYLPPNYDQGIVADGRFRMNKVRVRTDHAWIPTDRDKGAVVRMARNFQVTNCDIYAKGQGLVSGKYGLIANNKIMAMKTNTPLGGTRGMIVENNHFTGMDPTAYQNIGGSGRNIYYAHNTQESLFVHQADYSFTFDASTGGYLGGLEAQGTRLTLAGDPTYPEWAKEESWYWKASVVCILCGRGAGQWRDVVSNKGRAWGIDRPFDTPPDKTSVITIVPFNGRVLIIGNRFEDAAWVNAGYGTSIDVVCAENQVVRSALLMNFGVNADGWFEPSWYVQYFDNEISEGQTGIESTGGNPSSPRYPGPLTRWAVHRRHVLTADNSGSINIAGNIRDVIVEGCTLNHAMSTIKVERKEAQGVLLRNNRFAGTPSPRYEGDNLKNALVIPPRVLRP